jgi:urea carboxylase-associated protein 1
MATTTENPIAAAAIHEDTVVPAGEPWSARVAAGDCLRLVDLEGQQAVDFLCFNADDPAERYSAANTIKLAHNIYLNRDSVLWSSRARPMMTIAEDTCGAHDTIYGCCSVELDRIRYGKTKTRGCLSNFESELARYGLGQKDIIPNINFFMYVPVAADGAVAIAEGRSKPGDYVELRAEMDLLVVISNCPERDNPAAGGTPTPVRAIVYTPG